MFVFTIYENSGALIHIGHGNLLVLLILLFFADSGAAMNYSGSSGKAISVCANYLKLKVDKAQNVSEYEVLFQPQVHYFHSFLVIYLRET